MTDTDNAALRAEIDELRATVMALEERRDSRRALLRLAGAAAVGAAASAVGGNGRAAATDDEELQVGWDHPGKRTTALRFGTGPKTVSTGSADDFLFSVDNHADPDATSGAIFARGRSTAIVVSSDSVGLDAFGRAMGVQSSGLAADGIGVSGIGFFGVLGQGATGIRGVGTRTSSVGVSGLGPTAGVVGAGRDDGDGVVASGRYAFVATDSLRAAALLNGSGAGGPRTAPAGRGDAHLANELDADGAGNLWWCVASGSPGTWRKLSGPASAGAFHAITPSRVYDSRAAVPEPGVIAAGQTRDVSVASKRALDSGAVTAADIVPSGANAIACNVTVVNTASGGFLTLNPGGIATVAAATVNWSESGQILNNGVIVAINPATRQLTVVAGGGAGASTDFVIDVTGYFA